jgi:putative DNA primase/helicase
MTTAAAGRKAKSVDTNGRPITLADLARAKRLPVPFLEQLGVRDLPGGGVGIPYYGPAGEDLFVRQRDAPGRSKRFHQPAGVPLVPYGQHRLAEAHKVGFLNLVEGESDCWTLWHHGLPALGIPGNTSWNTLQAEHLAGIGTVYILREADQGGGTFIKGMTTRLERLGFEGKAFEVRCPGGIKDPSDLHASDPERFLHAFKDAILTATPIGLKRPLAGAPVAEGPPAFDGDPRAIAVDLLPVPALDEVLIPEPFRAWLTDIANRGCFPLEYPAAAAIVELASLVGRKVVIRPKRHDDWLVVPNLWGAIVGPPSVQKSPPVEEALRPLKRLVGEAKAEHEKEVSEFKVRKLANEAVAEATRKDLKKAASAHKDAAHLQHLARQALTTEEEKEPTLRRHVTSDPTVEKLGVILAENPNGILLFRDELTGWLRSLEKQGHENDRAFYLEAWSGLGSYDYDRIGRGTLHIPSTCVSIFGTIQPGPLARYLRATLRDNDGLNVRFQVLMYPDPPATWVNVDRYPNAEAKNRAHEVFKAIDALKPEEVGAEKDEARGMHFLCFAPDAQNFFDRWRGDLENRLRSGRDNALIQSHLGKYRSLMPSLALLFHLVEVVGGVATGAVTLRSAEAAAAWCELLEAHARRIYQAGLDGDPEAAVRLSERIKKSLPNPFKVRDVVQKGWSGLDSTEAVERAVGILEDRRWVKGREIPSGIKGGRQSTEYWVNPAILAGKAEGVL